jgi:hypothetical protein
MRKRILMGLLAVVVIVVLGLVAFVLSGPRKGSVEYHKKAYLQLREGSKFRNTLRLAWSKIDRRAAEPSQERIERMGRHHAALWSLGYLDEKVFLVSNREPAAVADALWLTLGRAFTNDTLPLVAISDIGTNSVTVEGPREEMFKWEMLIREADVTEGGK